MKYEILKLKNGMKIIVCFCPNFSSVYFDFAIKTGSVFENSKNNGLAHSVEHLVSKKAISNKKEKELQDYQLEFIIRQFKIEGKEFKKIDLRFDKPVIAF